MSWQQKVKKDEWNTCPSCRRLIHCRDTDDHADSCRRGQPDEHGFISCRCLHATVTTAKTNKALPEVLPSLKQDIVFIHPSAMSVCGWCLGQPCLVNGSQVLYAWPCSNLHPTSVALPSAQHAQAGVTEGSIVIVEQFVWGLLTASQVEVELRTVHSAFLKEEFLQFLSRKMNGKFIKQGSTHALSYFGLGCTFSIRSLLSVPVECCDVVCTLQKEQREGQTLSYRFSEMDISSVSESGDTVTESSSFSLIENFRSEESEPPGRSADNTLYHQSTTVRECCPSMQTDSNTSESASCRIVKVTAETEFVIVRQDGKNERAAEDQITFDCLGGLDQQIRTIRQLFDLHLNRPELEQKHGLAFSRGILLYGPSGTGKTTLAKAVANEMPFFTVTFSVSDFMSKFVGETEKKLRNLFQSASERNHSLIIIDNLDGLCPRLDDSSSDSGKRVVATFLTLLDGLSVKNSDALCIVLGITNRPDNIDPALRRPGRLDCDVETGVPSTGERFQILQKMLSNIPHSISEATLKDISDARHGFVGADLSLLVKKGLEHAAKRCRQDQNCIMMAEDILGALDAVTPSAMKEVKLQIPQVHWSDIGGQEEVKLKLRQAVEWQLRHPEVFTRFGISPPRGILMYGPPGCSKTMVAKALATESGLNFLAVKGPECFSKWVGESERAVREIFCKARAVAPSIIFFDEIDALAVERGSGGSNVADRVLTQLLTEMDGVERLNGVCVVAATNRPDKIDQALLRPGRFDQIVYVPLPDAATRMEILLMEFRRKPVAASVSVDELVQQTAGYSGAELTAVCKEAALSALQEDMTSQTISRRHFDVALSTVKPGTSAERVRFYEEYSKQRQNGLRFV